MGNLHDGHMKLVDEARARADIVVVSIFVNPMQFDREDDLARYPRTLQEDCEKLKNVMRISSSLRPRRCISRAPLNRPTSMCRVFRPCWRAPAAGHFRGVSTIVSKLFNRCSRTSPVLAKDFQQLALIRKMVADMGYDIEIVGVPIVRAKDGGAQLP